MDDGQESLRERFWRAYDVWLDRLFGIGLWVIWGVIIWRIIVLVSR